MITAVLLDDGGVMNDNELRGSQWRRLIGEFMVSRYGGTEEQWAEANSKVLPELMNRIDRMYQNNHGEIADDFYDQEHMMWTCFMFEYLGLKCPDNAIEISIEASKWITPQVNSAYPGIIVSIHELGKSYQMYTASNELSFELEGYLTGMGVVQYFAQFFGPDILRAFKSSPLYYERIIEQTGLNPAEAVVVDDKVKNLDYAVEVGFQVIHSGLEGELPKNYPYMNHASELPELIKSLF